MLSDRTVTVIVGVVTVIWAVNVIAGMIPHSDYNPPESINAIFVTIVGGALTFSKTRGKNGGGGDDRE